MANKGEVILVGAGPGDAGLLTLAGKAALEKADVVLHDRLAAPGILAMIPATALMIDVGKNKGNHPTPQEEINRLILEYAQQGKVVVRLKGGDPYLFGRGAEELARVGAAGIPFRVIPGVTSAIAAPAHAGVPVTHRDHSSSLHILTGHAKNGGAPAIPYPELARLGGTLVFLMSLSALRDICAGLTGAGMPGETAAALIENGTRSNQRRLTADLATLPDRAAEREFSSPALLVVGKVCALGDAYDWTSRLPLWGKNLLVVSSHSTAGRLACALREYGAEIDEFHGIRMEPLPLPQSFWQELGRYRWLVFTSHFGAETFLNGLLENDIDVRTLADAKIAVVGGRTGEPFRRRGIIPDLLPPHADGKELGRELGERAGAGEEILLFRAEAGNPDLVPALLDRNLAVNEISAYRTIKNLPHPAVIAKMRAGEYAALTFTSASAVDAFAEALDGNIPGTRTFCIGDMTAAAASRHGLRPETAPRPDLAAMAEMIVERMRHS